MKVACIRLLILAVLLSAVSHAALAADTYQPFILGSVSSGELEAKVREIKTALAAKGFSVVGDYVPYADTHVIVVTSNELKRIAAKTERGGYGAAQRIAVSRVGDQLQVAYANPKYIQYAYQLNADMGPVAQSLTRVLGNKESFGGKKGRGLSSRKLEKYHYAFGMEYYTEPYQLKSYKTHEEAVAAVERGLAKGISGTRKVYRIDVPGTDQTVFGVAMKAGPNDEKYLDEAFQMKEVDFGALRSSAYLPYEVLVKGGNIEALHMRFRMAVHFPGLAMMGKHSFMGLINSPEAVRKALVRVAGGTVEDDF